MAGTPPVQAPLPRPRWRTHLRFKLLSISKKPPPPHPTATAVLDSPLLFSKLGRGGKWAPSQFARAILFGVNSAIGYLLMLAVMSFNDSMFVAEVVVVVLGVGYLLSRGGDEDVLCA